MKGRTNIILLTIASSLEFAMQDRHGREIECCQILFDKKLTSSADKVTEKPNPRVWKKIFYTKYLSINSTLGQSCIYSNCYVFYSHTSEPIGENVCTKVDEYKRVCRKGKMRDVEKYFDKNEHHNGIQQQQKTYTL